MVPSSTGSIGVRRAPVNAVRAMENRRGYAIIGDKYPGVHGYMADSIIARTVNVAGLINYQDGSVVSRTVIENSNGTVTVFAFDKDQALSEHTAPYDAIVHVLDGEVEVTISGNPNIVKAGEMIVMPANDPHALKALTPFKMMLIMVKA
jgi:quercetin dioxygenase-like cupin family protein